MPRLWAQAILDRDAEAARADRAEAAITGMERRHRRELRAGSRELEEAHRALQDLSQRCRRLEADAKRLRDRQQDVRRCLCIELLVLLFTMTSATSGQ